MLHGAAESLKESLEGSARFKINKNVMIRIGIENFQGIVGEVFCG